MTRPRLICAYCERTPEQIGEYIDAAADSEMTPDSYVRAEEGTYNALYSTFACTDCYVTLGMPTRPRGWRAHPRELGPSLLRTALKSAVGGRQS